MLSQGGRYVPLLTLPRIASRADLDDVRSFFHSKDTAEFEASLAQTYETVEASLLFLERDAAKGGEVARWFRKYGHEVNRKMVPVASTGLPAVIEPVKPQSSLLYLF